MASCEGELHILVGSTGSVASVKVPKLVSDLQKLSTPTTTVQVRVIPTQHSLHFYDPTALSCEGVFRDQDEWDTWQKMGDPVLHIELRKWADVFVIAPLDANTLGKLSHGLCDNLLTCTARAWDFQKPMIVCPAMNTLMWQHPATKQQLDVLKTWGTTVVDPVSKVLACGDQGVGAMAHVDDIVAKVQGVFSL
eukprot:m.145872 g.145872  ORF g.145872 m.145872 type:complete len:193 (-) comp14144_c0_seq1:370-948(-)